MESTKDNFTLSRQKSDLKTMINIFNFVKYLSTLMRNFFVAGRIIELVLTNGR